MNDEELTIAALEACGHVAQLNERGRTRWVTVGSIHWHPLTNINQAMQLLQAGDLHMTLNYYGATCFGDFEGVVCIVESEPTPQNLIAAQCRAIVTACASLKGTL